MAWRQSLLTVVIAVAAALFVRHTVLTAYRVPTGSMQPALKPGDFIFSLRLAYAWASPERGDLVVFNYPHQPEVNYVKRVIALPGDVVEMRGNHLTLNKKAFSYAPVPGSERDNPNPALFEIVREVPDPSLAKKDWTIILEKGSLDKNFGPLVVPPGEIFLLGDNRDTSDDSRYWGTVPVSQITGKAALIWLSLDWQNKWGDNRFPRVRWQRVFSSPK